MEKKSIRMLLEAMLSNQHCFSTGLCHWAMDLEALKIITVTERRMLSKYINTHRPSTFSSITAWKHRKDDYFWEKRKIEPRLKWIEKHIKKLK